MAGKRKVILKAATIMFAEKGYNETSTAELARVTGVAEGTVFYHFKTKLDLLLAVLEDVKLHIVSEFNEYMDNRRFTTGMVMLEEVIAFLLYLVGRSGDRFMLIQRRYPHELARENEACRQHLEDIYNTLVDFFESAIRKGQEDGSIRSGPARKFALLLFSMANGLVWLRFNDLYDTASLYQELMAACRHMMAPCPVTPTQE